MNTGVPPALATKKWVVQLDAPYVDIAEDAAKIATIFFFVACARFLSVNPFPAMTTDVLVPAALGLVVYYLAIRKFVAFVPKPGQESYYNALKKYR